MSPFTSVRRRLVVTILAAVAMVFGAAQQSSIGVAAQGAERVNVLISFAALPGPAEAALVRAAGGEIRYTYHLVSGMAASLPAQALAGLRNNPRVVAIELDGRVEAFDAELDLTWGVARIGSGTAHAGGVTGAGVRVAVFDSGVEYTHFELSHAYAGGWDFVNGDDDPLDDNGHGTHVSGTIAAADDDAWVVGAAPGVQLFGIKVLDGTGGGDFSDVIAGIEWALDHGIQVANHSYGSATDPGTLFQQAFTNSAAAGMLHIAAAGNTGNCRGTGNSVGYPAKYTAVVAIGATDANDARPCYSSTGAEVDLAAPGDWIPSSYLNNDVAYGSGTSMASPHVAGAAALLMSAGTLNATTVRSLLTSTAQDLGASGRDKFFGDGLVNVAAALTAAGAAPASRYVALSTDSTRYAETDTAAVLTVKVTDHVGAPQSGLVPSHFSTTFDGSPAGVAFAETATPGTYTATADISAVGPGQHAFVVTETDTGLTGRDTAAFHIGSPPVPGTIHVPSITYASSGGRGGSRNVYITVTTVNGSGAPVANAAVTVIVYINNVPWSFGQGTTNVAGQVTFTASSAPSGTYYTEVAGVSAGALVWDNVTPPNSFVK